MCDKNSNLNKAILAQVQTFATNNTNFSVHDITVALRKSANAGNLNLPEFETPSGQYKYEIPHSSVKDAFSELLSDGIFTEINLQLNRNYNGVYFEYTAVPTVAVAAPAIAASAAVVGVPPSNGWTLAGTPRLDAKSVATRIDTYLQNHIGLTVTIENIRAAIKCNGWTCSEIQDIAKTFVTVNVDSEYPSKSTVQL